MDACGTLFEYLVYLSGGDVKKLSDLLNQLSSRELLQVNGVIHCKGKAGWASFNTLQERQRERAAFVTISPTINAIPCKTKVGPN